ncbi:MAG: PEP-CTERM sorting domain-containing protein [Luteolibacter sp.]
MNKSICKFTLIATAAISGFFSSSAQAVWIIQFSENDFSVSNTYNNLQTFNVEIRIAGDLTTGIFNNPALVGVDYTVSGILPNATPSGFPGFVLNRPEGVGSFLGNEFYNQGSSLNFEIASNANLSDGLQFSELVGGANAFVFYGREVGTGRYHPPIIELNGDGSGLIENSNNFGGINPATNQEVDVARGEEYSSTLAFDPMTFTIGSVPEPSSLTFLSLGVWALFRRRRC